MLKIKLESIKDFILLILCSSILLYSLPSYSFGDDFDTFRLDPVKEVYLLAAGFSLNISGEILISGINSTNTASLHSEDLLPFDRCAVNYYSKRKSIYSDNTRNAAASMALLAVIPLLNGVNRESIRTVTTDCTILFETELITFGLIQSSKGIFRRARPYAYNENLSLEKRRLRDASLSFLSGHTTFAFATAVASAYIYQNRYPDSPFTLPVWIFGLSCATATGVFRVNSGNHFPSDVLASAAVGSLSGWLIPKIHRSYNDKVTVSPLINDTLGVIISSAF